MYMCTLFVCINGTLHVHIYMYNCELELCIVLPQVEASVK